MATPTAIRSIKGTKTVITITAPDGTVYDIGGKRAERSNGVLLVDWKKGKGWTHMATSQDVAVLQPQADKAIAYAKRKEQAVPDFQVVAVTGEPASRVGR